jgi:hypothetical protein
MSGQRGADCDLTPGRGWFISSQTRSKYIEAISKKIVIEVRIWKETAITLL